MEFKLYDNVRVRGRACRGVLVDGPYLSCGNSRGWSVEVFIGDITVDMIVCNEEDLFLISRQASNKEETS